MEGEQGVGREAEIPCDRPCSGSAGRRSGGGPRSRWGNCNGGTPALPAVSAQRDGGKGGLSLLCRHAQDVPDGESAGLGNEEQVLSHLSFVEDIFHVCKVTYYE